MAAFLSSSPSFAVSRRAAPTATAASARRAAGPLPRVIVVASSSTPRAGARRVAPPTPAIGISTPLAAEASVSAEQGPVPSLRELRASIPKECFEPDVSESLRYAAYDLAALAACFGVFSPVVVGFLRGLGSRVVGCCSAGRSTAHATSHFPRPPPTESRLFSGGGFNRYPCL